MYVGNANVKELFTIFGGLKAKKYWGNIHILIQNILKILKMNIKFKLSFQFIG